MQSISQFVKRRRLINRLIGAALALTVMVIAVSLWRGRDSAGKRTGPIPAVPKGVEQQASGYTFTRSDEGRQVFTIHATRTVAFKEGGTTVLEGVQVEVFGKGGDRRDVLHTTRCDYNTVSGDLFSSGNVEIELNAPLSGKPAGPLARSVMLETSQLYFRHQGSLVESDQPVKFRYGAISGSARGMSYATREGRLELKSNVQAELQPEPGGARPIGLTASSARFEKDSRVVNFAGPVEVTQGLRRAAASSATLFLDERNRLMRAAFDGPVRVSDAAKSAPLEATAASLVAEFDPGTEALRRAVAEIDVEVESRRSASLSRLAAQRIEISFDGVPSVARRGTASGGVRIIEVAIGAAGASPASGAAPGRSPPARRELSASGLNFTFHASGRSLKDAATRDAGKLVLVPVDARLGERIVTAGRMLMSFDERNRLETMRGEGGTRIRFEPGRNSPPGSVAQESTAERLLAVIDTATGSVRTLEQMGDFHYREGDRQATAERASYQTATESLTLTGKPQVRDSELLARAEKIQIDLASGRAEGQGKVESTHTGGASRADPTSVLADRVVAERRSQTVRYEGHVRAWRGADVVESAALEIFRAERRVRSGTRVLTSHLQPAAAMGGAAATNGKVLTRPVTIRAEHLEYSDQGRRAAYRGSVRLQTENTTLEADRLDAYFRESGQATELERAIAEGNVKITQPGRRATGRHAEYFSADGKIVMSGGPPTLYDAEKGFTSGQSLTFYSRDDRLLVSGGDKSATISRHRIGQ